jgi:hypothetical protein
MRAAAALQIDVDVLLAREAQELLDALAAGDCGSTFAADATATMGHLYGMMEAFRIV